MSWMIFQQYLSTPWLSEMESDNVTGLHVLYVNLRKLTSSQRRLWNNEKTHQFLVFLSGVWNWDLTYTKVSHSKRNLIYQRIMKEMQNALKFLHTQMAEWFCSYLTCVRFQTQTPLIKNNLPFFYTWLENKIQKYTALSQFPWIKPCM